MDNILMVGIAGGSGSGKSTLTDNIVKRFGNEVTVVHHDNYYRAHNDLTYEERAALNYDCPDAYENELMAEQLRLLKAGRPVRCPVYDFTVHNRSTETLLIEPKPVIIVEGILILAEKELRDQLDIKIFVETDADTRLCRRIKRDMKKRGRSVESVLSQWQTTVKPMYELYVEPSRKNADIVVLEGGKNLVALSMITGEIEKHIRETKQGD